MMLYVVFNILPAINMAAEVEHFSSVKTQLFTMKMDVEMFMFIQVCIILYLL
jgi:hypothetical protein